MSERPHLPWASRARAGKERLPGVRSAERAVQNGFASAVYVAKDADERVVRNLLRLCREKGIPVAFFDSMKELGKFCSLRVGAAACAILKNPGDSPESGHN